MYPTWNDAPPVHPQPSFYDQLKVETGIDPEVEGRPRTHQTFMREADQESWLKRTLMRFDSGELGKTTRRKQPTKKKGRR